MNSLKQAVRTYASHHANRDGLATTSVPGLGMMCVEAPAGDLHSIYRPLVCFVLQGAKRMIVGNEERVFHAGQSVIVAADMPVVGRIVEASPNAPYLAIAVELEMALLREVVAQMGDPCPPRSAGMQTLFAEDTEGAMLDCASRLMHLLDRPDAAPILRPGIMRELHYWLLSGQHRAALHALADPDSCAGRLGAAIAILRADYRLRLPIGPMGPTEPEAPGRASERDPRRTVRSTPHSRCNGRRRDERERLRLAQRLLVVHRLAVAAHPAP
jgi:hypothetical protein